MLTRDPALPPARPRAARRDRPTPDDTTLREFLDAAASRRTSAGTSWSRSSPPSGRATRRSRSTTRRATCSRSSTTTACSAVSGSPQWRTVTGGSREYVARVAAGLDDVRVGTKVTSVLETADGRRGHRRQRRHARRTTPSWSRPTPTRRWRCWPSRPRPSASCSPRCPTPTNVALLHTDASAAAAGRARPGLVELPAASRGDRGPGHGHLRPDPAAAAAHRHPLPGHPRRRGPRRPATR